MDRGPLPPKGSMGGSPRFQNLLYSMFLRCFRFSRRLRSKVQVGRQGSNNCFPTMGRAVLFFGTAVAQVKWVGLGWQRDAER